MNDLHRATITCFAKEDPRAHVIGMNVRVWLDDTELRGVRDVEYRTSYDDVQEITITLVVANLNAPNMKPPGTMEKKKFPGTGDNDE